jgi:hypothetical protein
MKWGTFEIDLSSGKRVYVATMIFAILTVAMLTPTVAATVLSQLVLMAMAVVTWYFATHKTEPETKVE